MYCSCAFTFVNVFQCLYCLHLVDGSPQDFSNGLKEKIESWVLLLCSSAKLHGGRICVELLPAQVLLQWCFQVICRDYASKPHPECKVNIYLGEYDDFRLEFERRNWHKVLEDLPNEIDEVLVIEFMSMPTRKSGQGHAKPRCKARCNILAGYY